MADTSQNSTSSIAQPQTQTFSSADIMNAIENLSKKFDTLDTKIDSVDRKVSEQAKSLNKIEKSVEEVEGKVFVLENNTDKMKDEIQQLKTSEVNLRSELESLKESIRSIDKKTDENNQYSRRENIRIYGVEEQKVITEDGFIKSLETDNMCLAKVLSVFNSKMGLQIKDADITAVHRLGKLDPTLKGGRAIIVRFISRRVRDQVLGQRKMIFKTGIVITEDLSPKQYNLLSQVKNDKEVCKNAWTRNGVVFMKTHSEHIVKIQEPADINDRLKRQTWSIKWEDFQDNFIYKSQKRPASVLTPEEQSNSPLGVYIGVGGGTEQPQGQTESAEGGQKFQTPKKFGLEAKFSYLASYRGRGGGSRGFGGRRGKKGIPRFLGFNAQRLTDQNIDSSVQSLSQGTVDNMDVQSNKSIESVNSEKWG